MTTPSEIDSIPQTGFDPVAFWLAHKTKVIIYGSLLLLVAAIVGYYEYANNRELGDARAKLAQATTEDDYRQVIQKFPRTVAAGDASLLLAGKLRDGKDYPGAITVLQAMIADEPNHPLIDAAWLSLASTYNAQGNPQAVDTYQQIATKFADRFSAPMALFSVAEILKSEGKLDEAKTAYENVQSQFPKTYFAEEALQKLQELKK